MKKQIIISVAVAGLVLISSVWFLNHRDQRDVQPGRVATTRAVPPADTAAGNPSQEPRGAVHVSPARPMESAAATDLTGPVNPPHVAEVRKALAELKNIYSHAGSLDWDQAKALVARREKATQDLVKRLANLGPGGARAIAAGYNQADSTRARLLLVQALGRSNDAEAADVLQTLLGRDDSFSVRKEMVLALGQRRELAATQALADTLAGQEDAQLRFASAQALSGRENALPVLAERLRSEGNTEVQRELIRSVGLVKSPEAMNVLAGVAQRSENLALRQTAIQELRRAFGASALGILGQLQHDVDTAVRQSATHAVARLRTEAAAR